MARSAVSRSIRLVVVGAGPAGVSAAVEAVRLGFEPLVLDRDGEAGGLIRHAFEVRNFPGGRKPGLEIAGLFAAQLRQWGVPVERREVVSVERHGRGVVIRDTSGVAIKAGAAVVATGTEPVIPLADGLPFSFGGVLHAMADTVLDNPVNGRAAVIGGSDAAFDQARRLAAAGIETLVVCRSTIPSAPPWLVSEAIAEGVEILAGGSVRRAERAGTGLILYIGRSRTGSGVFLDEGDQQSIAVDAVVTAVGRRPLVPRLPEEGRPVRVVVAGDARGGSARYLCAAMADGCLAARELLKPNHPYGGYA